MTVCAESGCVGLATPGGTRCAPHAAGFKIAETSIGYRCSRCRRMIRKGDWYRRAGNGVVHASKACKEWLPAQAKRVAEARR